MRVHCQNRERESQRKQIMPTTDNGGWPTLRRSAEKSLLTSVWMPGKQEIIYCLTNFKAPNPHTVDGYLTSVRLSKIGSRLIPEIKIRFGRISWSSICCYEAAPSSSRCLCYLTIKLLPRYYTIKATQAE